METEGEAQGVQISKILTMRHMSDYASVGGAPRHTVVIACVCVCLYVFHAHFSATAKN